MEDLSSDFYDKGDNIHRIARALMMLNGLAKWDGALIAELLRDEGNTSKLFKLGLAELIEGNRHPLKLTLSGSGKSTLLFEQARLYERNIEVGQQAQSLIDKGESWEAATNDVAVSLDIHENTVRLALKMYRISQDYADAES